MVYLQILARKMLYLEIKTFLVKVTISSPAIRNDVGTLLDMVDNDVFQDFPCPLSTRAFNQKNVVCFPEHRMNNEKG